MSRVTNIVIGTVIGAGVVGLAKFFVGLNNTSAELQTELDAKVHSLTLKGMTVRANILLKNPTNGSLTMTQPTVQVIQNGKVLATSKVGQTRFTIGPRDEKPLEPIEITVPFTGLLSVAGALLSFVIKKQVVNLTVRAITNVDLGLATKDFKKDQNITLKPKTA